MSLRPGLLVEETLRPWLYLLAESDTGWVRYVGRTINPTQRVSAHRTDSLRDWQKELRRRGARIQMILLRQIDAGEDEDAAEQAELNRRSHLDGLLNRRSASGRHAAFRFRRHLLVSVGVSEPSRNG